MKKFIKILIIIYFVVNMGNTYAQKDYELLEINKGINSQNIEVDFLSESPILDGFLDKNLEFLPKRVFNLVYKSKDINTIPLHYRLGYGTYFLYVYIEVEAQKLTYRDRAYQNGDGFVLTIAQIKPNNEPTDEYYDLACSAVNTPQLEWTRRIFWNYNVDKIFQLVGEDTKHEFAEKDGKICFELLLPWSDIKPLHPWISDGIGFNLVFSKAEEKENVSFYSVIKEHLNALSKRNYHILKFQKPLIKGKTQTFVSIKEGHIFSGDSVHITVASIAENKSMEGIVTSIKSGEGQRIGMSYKMFGLNQGLNINKFSILPSSMKADNGYQICWVSLSNLQTYGNRGISVLSKFNKNLFDAKLETIKLKISQGSFQTIQFKINELQTKIKLLKYYETAYNETQNIIELKNIIDLGEKGIDTLAKQTGFVRKAYLSKLDATYQPYMVYIPRNYNKSQKYPLVIYLHGSESNETNIMSFRQIIPEGFIGLGVFGRGPSNGFTSDHAQDDIAEAIESVKNNYSIDDKRIIVTGFSMGGYGVYRTFFETPTKFRAIAIFSGGPNLGSHYSKGEPAPDFNQESNLKVFKDAKIFIFHGENDLNVSFIKTKEFVEKLKKAGALVEFVTESKIGHDLPDFNTLNAYYSWIKNVMK